MDNKIIIFDFEVFKYDVLLGTIILEDNKEPTYYQTWDKEEIKRFYESSKDNSIYVGHNNESYDNMILQAIIKDNDPKVISDRIVEEHKSPKLLIKLYYYDLMKFHQTSLKALEAFMGKNISETEVDFNLDRPLTKEEKELTEKYNRDDLAQTLDDFNYLKDEFNLRLDIISEFGLSLDCLSSSEAQLAAKVLKAKKVWGIETNIAKPKMWDTLRVKNQRVIDFYMNCEWAAKKTLSLDFCGTKHKIASGGIHAAEENCHYDFAYYLDVSGYYNLIMILLDLLPRSIPEEGKKQYEYMYHEQLRLKKINPRKRQAYKVILLAVFGAQNNEYSEFYDPSQGDLVRLSGQMFLVDLLEKLEGKAHVIQSNTDGIMVYPLVSEEEVLAVIKEWQDRTGFTLKLDKIYNLTQRDVNNYTYVDKDGEIHTKGECLKHYKGDKTPYVTNAYNSKEPLIIAEAVTEFLVNGKLPEQTISENKDNLRLFQWICKKQSFDYVKYEEARNDGTIIETSLQHVNRAFASNKPNCKGMIYKYKRDGGKIKKNKISNLSESVFVYNEEINSPEAIQKVSQMIDFDYYVVRSYERILEFIKEE